MVHRFKLFLDDVEIHSGNDENAAAAILVSTYKKFQSNDKDFSVAFEDHTKNVRMVNIRKKEIIEKG